MSKIISGLLIALIVYGILTVVAIPVPVMTLTAGAGVIGGLIVG
jgi:hypothetical protein